MKKKVRWVIWTENAGYEWQFERWENDELVDKGNRFNLLRAVASLLYSWEAGHREGKKKEGEKT